MTFEESVQHSNDLMRIVIQGLFDNENILYNPHLAELLRCGQQRKDDQAL